MQTRQLTIIQASGISPDFFNALLSIAKLFIILVSLENIIMESDAR